MIEANKKQAKTTRENFLKITGESKPMSNIQDWMRFQEELYRKTKMAKEQAMEVNIGHSFKFGNTIQNMDYPMI